MSSFIFLFRPVSISWDGLPKEPVSLLCESCFLENKKSCVLEKNGPGSYIAKQDSEFWFWEYPDMFAKDSVQLKFFNVTLGSKKLFLATSVELRNLYRMSNEGLGLFQTFKTTTTKIIKSNNTKWDNPLYLLKKQYKDASAQMTNSSCIDIATLIEFCVVSVDRIRGSRKTTLNGHCSILHHLIGKHNHHMLNSVLSSLSNAGVLKSCLKCENDEGMNVLQAALLAGDHDLVYVLITRCGFECFPLLQHKMGNVLHIAISGQSLRCLKLILSFLRKFALFSDEGFSLDLFLNQRNGIDDTPLSLACRNVISYEMVEILIFYGADVSITVDFGNKTPLICACMSGSIDSVKYLMSVCKSDSELRETSEGISKSLKQRSGIFSVFDNKSLASGFENRLITYQCNPTFCSPSTGRQALHEAVTTGNIDIVDYLIKCGVPIETIDGIGNSVLHLALMHNQFQMFGRLLEYEKQRFQQFSSRENCLATMYICSPLLLLKNMKGTTALDILLKLNSQAELVDSTLNFIALNYFDGKMAIDEILRVHSSEGKVGKVRIECSDSTEILQECDSAFDVQYHLALTALALRMLGNT